jgi:hypothetical protein
MRREELLSEFEREHVIKALKKQQENIYKYILKNREKVHMEIKNTLIEILKESIKIQEENKNAEVGSIIYSVMRSSISEERFEYLIGVYGKYFLLEKPLIEKIESIEWGYKYYKDAVDNIAESGKKYMNLLGKADIERFGQKYLILLHNEIKEEMIEIFADIHNCKEYKELNKTEEFKIFAGEYIGHIEKIYEEKKG